MLAGYISGTRVELAKVRIKDGVVDLVDRAGFAVEEFSNLEGILSLYLKKSKELISTACFGVAGPVINNEVRTTRLRWQISAATIQKKFGIQRVKLLNDIVATAFGLPELPASRFYTLNEGVRQEKGNVALIAAGTGLGEALIYTDGQQVYPYASEGGHADFAPGTQLECDLWQFVYAELGHVEVEDIVSLSGLARVYRFVCETARQTPASWFETAEDQPMALIEMGLSGKDELVNRTLDLFIECYASEAANLALKAVSLGGVYIGGRIAPQIITLLDKGSFMERFVKRGKMETLLGRMPVGVIIEDKAALIGAAAVVARM